MADTTSTQIWMGRLTYILLACLIIFIQLLPLDTRPQTWAAPDVLLAMTMVWVARRPDLIPVWVIAGVFLLTDLLYQRPPGLWSGLAIILTEMLRARSRSFRHTSFALEWGSVAAGIIAITMVNRATLAVVITPQAPLGLTLIEMVMTIVIYPLVLIIAHYVFGVSRPTPAQAQSLGQRI